MATLYNPASGETRLVEPEHTFGRAPTSSECIAAEYVSAQHAALRWTGRRWVLRDLGSRNGTYLNGVRIAAGDEQPVQKGMKLSFGKPGENTLELTDDAPPVVMAVPVGGGEPALLSGELLALPSSDVPEVTIYRASENLWLIERANAATTPITNLQTFEAGGQTWKFCCAESGGETALATVEHELQVRHLQLRFSVSSDEEFVSLQATCGGRTFDMGTRNHNYLLLVLARHRLQDAADGLPETSCGWVYQEDVTTGSDSSEPGLNLDVYRIRRQFGAIGVTDAATIIERRPRTRQLRIGAANLTVFRL
jgi:FHA domain